MRFSARSAGPIGGRATDPIKAIDLLLGRDPNSMRYLKYFRATEKLRQQKTAVKV
jgi:hypothetical protein